MSEGYRLACFTCKCHTPNFAWASGFHRMHTQFGNPLALREFEDWLGEHEPIKGGHDVRIVWEQTDLPWEGEE